MCFGTFLSRWTVREVMAYQGLVYWCFPGLVCVVYVVMALSLFTSHHSSPNLYLSTALPPLFRCHVMYLAPPCMSFLPHSSVSPINVYTRLRPSHQNPGCLESFVHLQTCHVFSMFLAVLKNGLSDAWEQNILPTVMDLQQTVICVITTPRMSLHPHLFARVSAWWHCLQRFDVPERSIAVSKPQP